MPSLCVCCLNRILCWGSGGHAFSWDTGAIHWVAFCILCLWLVPSSTNMCYVTFITIFLTKTAHANFPKCPLFDSLYISTTPFHSRSLLNVLFVSYVCVFLSLSPSPRQLWDILVFVLDSGVIRESCSPSHHLTRGEEIH